MLQLPTLLSNMLIYIALIILAMYLEIVFQPHILHIEEDQFQLMARQHLIVIKHMNHKEKSSMVPINLTHLELIIPQFKLVAQ